MIRSQKWTKSLSCTYNRNRSFQTGDKVFGLTLVVRMNFAGSAPLKDLPKPP